MKKNTTELLKALMNKLDTLGTKRGMPITAVRVLFEIYKEGGQPQKYYAEELHLPQNSLHRYVKNLHELGLVLNEDSDKATWGKVKVVSVTKEGAAFCKETFRILEGFCE